MKIKKNNYSVKQVFEMLGCKHCKRFPLFGDIDIEFCDCVFRTCEFLYYIIKRSNFIIVCCCDKQSKFCYTVSVGVL